MINPDPYIRQAFVDQLNNITVEGENIIIHDYRIPKNKDYYILMATQWMKDGGVNKCDFLTWDCGITLDIVTIYDNISGSRFLVDKIKERVMNLTQNMVIDNFENNNQTMSFPDDIQTITSTQNIYKKLIQYEFKLTQK